MWIGECSLCFLKSTINYFVMLMLTEGVLSWHHNVSSRTSLFVIAGYQAYNRSVVSKLNDGVGVTQSHIVVGEQGVQQRTEDTPLG